MPILTEKEVEYFIVGGEEGEQCAVCGSSVMWEGCEHCGGEGEFEVYDLDPLDYEPGDTERCSQCDGAGGWWRCLGTDTSHAAARDGTNGG